MRRPTIAGALGLVAVTALPLGAQQHRHMGAQDSAMSRMQMMQGGMMQGGMMGMMGMMRSMTAGPGMILNAGEELGLTEDQKARLTTLREEMQDMHGQHMGAAMATHQAAAVALEGDSPDLDAYREQVEAAAGHMVEMHMAMARAGLQAREVLTPEQRAQLKDVMSRMRHMHGNEGGMGHGEGMMHGSGMRSGAGVAPVR